MVEEYSNDVKLNKPFYKKPLFIVLIFLLIVWFGVPLVTDLFMPKAVNTNTAKNSDIKLPNPVKIQTWSDSIKYLGSVSAPVSIVEFGDFECPFCKESAPVIKQLLSKYPEAIRFQFRDNPITDIHKEALNAAEAANCADRQGKYWPYHDELYNQQDSLGQDLYQSIATKLQLNLSDFNTCLSGHLTLAKVTKDFELGQQLGVTGTPTFFVNGRMIPGHVPLELWDKIIALTIKTDLNTK